MVKLKPATFIKVEDLTPGARGINLKVKVLSSDIVVNKVRPDGSKIKISETVIGDDTGTIILTAKNEQVDTSKPGSNIIIRNGKIKMFKGFMRLNVDKWGLVEEDVNPESFDVKDDNLSLVEYELVLA